jgi:hypothetical protein
VRSVLILALVLAPRSLVACGETQGPDPTPHPEASDGRAAVRIVDEEDADLVLYVSNQSFDDELVRLTVAVDGVTVVDGDFHVEDQHHWVSFPLAMPADAHEITATSDSGARLRESFRVPGDKARYAVIDHWGEGDSAELTWLFQRQPLAFA